MPNRYYSPKTTILYLSVIIIVLSVLRLGQYISKPFWEQYDWNSNTWSLIAKNYIYRGFICTKFGQAITSDLREPCDNLTYYQNHPVMVPVLVMISYKILGVQDTSARIIFIIISVLSSLVLYAIGITLFNRCVGLFAAISFILTPMYSRYGKLINHEPVVLFLSLLTTYLFIGWIRRCNNLYYYLYLLIAFFIGITGWHGYLLYPLFSILIFIKFPGLFLKSMYPNLILFAAFLLHLLHSAYLSGFAHLPIVYWFAVRTSLLKNASVASEITDFTFLSYLHYLRIKLYSLLTPTLCLGSIFYLFHLLINQLRGVLPQLKHQVTITLLLFALSIVVIFSQQVRNHEYILYYFLPFVSLSTASFVESILNHKPYALVYIIYCLLLVIISIQAKPTLVSFNKKINPYYFSQINLAQKISLLSGRRFLLTFCDKNGIGPQLFNYAFGKRLRCMHLTVPLFMQKRLELEQNYDYIIIESRTYNRSLLSALNSLYNKREYNSFNVFAVSCINNCF